MHFVYSRVHSVYIAIKVQVLEMTAELSRGGPAAPMAWPSL